MIRYLHLLYCIGQFKAELEKCYFKSTRNETHNIKLFLASRSFYNRSWDDIFVFKMFKITVFNDLNGLNYCFNSNL